MPNQQDPRAISLQRRLDNWAAKELAHIPTGSRGIMVRSWYAQQGFLMRAALSPFADQIIAGGAWSLLITLLDQHYVQRVTQDLDLDLPQVDNEPDLRAMLQAIISTPLPPDLDDHLAFDSTFSLKRTLPGTDAGGYRVVLQARLGPTTRILFTLDLALAFAVVPQPAVVQVPRLLQPQTTIAVRLAPVEAVLAGKVASLLKNGFRTTRYKDFYDCWLASQQRDFAGDRMLAALQATCQQQSVALNPQAEVFTSVEAPLDAQQGARWETFLADNWITAPAFPVVVQTFRAFYLPVVEGSAAGSIWQPRQQEWIAVAQEPEREQ